MHLSRLSLINFKNYTEVELDLNEGVNCFLGNNGEGKTNLLDAVYYLSYCKSYFNSVDSQNIRFDQPFFVIQGDFQEEEHSTEIYCGVKKGQKKQFKRNKSPYKKLADHIGLYPSVIITPYDSNLILDGSEVRRKFLDAVISQFDKSYLEALISYNKALSQRNAYLKQAIESGQFSADLLEIWDMQLIDKGDFIFETRSKFLNEFIEGFDRLYKEISQGKEDVLLRYKTALNESSMKEVLSLNMQKDRYSGYTTGGIHKDDLEFLISGNGLKKFASQGQQKSFLIALKLAQYEFIYSQTKVKPILLLDDIYDKLDNHRLGFLLSLLSSDKIGQTFITDTDLNRVPDILESKGIEHSAFEVSNLTSTLID